MAGATDLKVRVGLLFDEKSLNNIERQLRNSGRRLSDIGTDLTLSLSAPLALFGAASIKAAGDIESLTLALKSQLGTADAAAAELDKLTDAAKNPGIGLEQAVRGSVRLQGVGFAAEEARETLVQMGNAIAATGGSAQELDNVTRQFAQMTSKGRVLQEDVSILSENMPGLAGLMQKAFGTQSVEAIRDMGISGKEFVKQITAAASELPRVEGGINNGIGNAMDSLKQSAAKVGLAINEAFNVTGSIETLSSAILFLAEGFASLDGFSQKVILTFAGLLIAIGPLMKAYGAFQLLQSTNIKLWQALLATPVGAWMKDVHIAFNALNAATKAFIVIGLITAVLHLAGAFEIFNREATAAEKVQTSLNKLSDEAEASISTEKGAVDRLIGVLQSETTTREAKIAALNELKRINPEYFGQLSIENGAVNGLTAAYEAYIANIRLAAKAKKAEARLIEIDEQKTKELQAQKAAQEELNKLQSAAPVRRGGFGAKDSFDTSGATQQAGALAAVVTSSKALVAQLDLESESLTKLSQAGFEAVAKEKIAAQQRSEAAEKLAKERAAAAAGTGELSKAGKVLADVLDDITKASEKAKLLGEPEDIAKVEALKKGIERLIDAGFKPASAEVQNLKTQLDALTEKPRDIVIDVIASKPGGAPTIGQEERAAPVISPVAPTLVSDLTAAQEAFQAYADKMAYAKEIQDQLSAGTFNFQTGLSEVTAKLIEQGNVFGAVFTGMADALAQSAAQGETSMAKLAQSAAGAAAKVVRSYIQIGVARVVSSAFQGLPFPLNLAAGPIAGAAAAAIFTKAIGAIGIKGFARGTSNAPGGVALVGEQGPELVNLPRGSQVFPTPKTNQMLSNMGGGGVTVGGEFTVRGTDLVLILDRANQKNQRFR